MTDCPPSIFDSDIAPAARTKDNNEPTIIPGAANGISIILKICHFVAPKSAAACLASSGTIAIPCAKGKSINGK